MNSQESIDPIHAISGVGGGQGSIYYQPASSDSAINIMLAIIAVVLVALLFLVIKR